MNESILEKYLVQMSNAGRSESTVNTAKSILKNFFIWYGDKDVKQITADDVEKYIHYIITTKFDQHGKNKPKKKLEALTVFQKKSSLRQFLKWLYKTYPEAPDLTTCIELRRVKRKELPDRLTDEEIRSMIGKSQNPRDKAMIAFLAESGCRKGELLNIKLRHIRFFDDGTAEVHLPRGHTVARRIYVIWSAAYLFEWLNSHPLKDDSEAYCFCSNRKPFGMLSSTGFWEQVKTLAERAGIKKRVYAHLFRHTAATRLAQQ